MPWPISIPGVKLTALKPLTHNGGDDSDRWPVIPEGAQVEFLEIWSDHTGKWIRILGPNGEEYDIDPKDLVGF